MLLSVVHADRDYTGVQALARVPLAALIPLEDRFADLLLAQAARSKHVDCVIADRPRAFIDLNREEADLDRAMTVLPHRSAPSARARHGLGLIPSRLPEVGALWRRPLDATELAERLRYYRKFHGDLALRLQGAQARHGTALLLDVHTMPPLAGSTPVDVVIGDRYGTTASREVVDAIDRTLRAASLRTAVNHPYAGGAVVHGAGNPANNIHAVQLEFSRALYLDATLREPGAGLPRLQQLVASLANELAAMIPAPVSLAAE